MYVVYVPIPIPIPIRVRLASARDSALWSSLSQDLGPWISPQYPSYPTLSPLSEATTCQYRSRQVVKDRHKQTQTKQSQSFPNCTYDQYLQSTYSTCVIHQSQHSYAVWHWTTTSYKDQNGHSKTVPIC